MNPASTRRIYLLGAAALAIAVGIVIAFWIWSWDDPPIVSAFEWTPSGTGMEIAGLFFALGFIACSRALTLNQPREGARQIIPAWVFGLASVAAAWLVFRPRSSRLR